MALPSDSLSVLIVDDEPFAREKISQFLAEEEDVVVVGQAGNGKQALDIIGDQAPDLVFLDIQMPSLNGLEVLQQIPPQSMPLIIFVSAYDQFAIAAFELHALDYLLKPYDRQRFFQALSRARQRLRVGRAAADAQAVLSLVAQWRAPAEIVSRLVVRKPNRAYFVSLADILWVKADGKSAQCRANGELHPLRSSLAALEKKLDPQKFQRVHRTYIVQLEKIREIQNWFWGSYLLIMADDSQVITGRTYREKIKQLLER